MSFTCALLEGELYIEENERIAVIQPAWPDGTPWANEAEALAWGNAWIAHQTDPEFAAIAPGLTPSEPTRTIELISEPTPQEEPSA